MDEKSADDELDNSIKTNLGSYFNNNTPTIFDEIVSPNNSDNVLSSSDALFNFSSTSKNIFETESLIEQTSDNIVINECHRDAWIPSENTRQILNAIAATSLGSHEKDSSDIDKNLTMPGLALADEMIDPIKETAVHFLDEEEYKSRNILTISDVTQDERGLRKLIKEGSYRAAINLSGRLLGVYGQGFGKINHPSKHTPHSLQLWFTRLSLLTKLKQIDILEIESAAFGNLDNPDMYFIFYPELYGTRPGSMASFSFRLLIAEIPMYCGKSDKALNNLFSLLAVVNKIIKNLENNLSEEGGIAKYNEKEKNDSLQLWRARKSRTLISIINCSLTIKKYILATEVLEQLLESNKWKKSQVDIITAAIGRIHLSLGDVSAAENIFNNIHSDKSSKSETVRGLVDKGLTAVAQNSFQEALNYFKTASDLDPNNIMLINNMAVCLLYTGKLEAAVNLMENLITVSNPVQSLQESILLNMSTLYELHTTHSRQFKIQLLRQLNRFNGDATNVQCLKLAL